VVDQRRNPFLSVSPTRAVLCAAQPDVSTHRLLPSELADFLLGGNTRPSQPCLPQLACTTDDWRSCDTQAVTPTDRARCALTLCCCAGYKGGQLHRNIARYVATYTQPVLQSLKPYEPRSRPFCTLAFLLQRCSYYVFHHSGQVIRQRRS